MKNDDYTPPKVWTWDKENGGEWAGINRPIAGPTHEEVLPKTRGQVFLFAINQALVGLSKGKKQDLTPNSPNSVDG